MEDSKRSSEEKTRGKMFATQSGKIPKKNHPLADGDDDAVEIGEEVVVLALRPVRCELDRWQGNRWGKHPTVPQQCFPSVRIRPALVGGGRMEATNQGGTTQS